ncbi:hypothetical protein ABW19_dt0200792 [Dactylella cylindrospora]|nr:hypothetical protein ABW19_dt0200792 [Dactylella cylindrospora]
MRRGRGRPPGRSRGQEQGRGSSRGRGRGRGRVRGLRGRRGRPPNSERYLSREIISSSSSDEDAVQIRTSIRRSRLREKSRVLSTSSSSSSDKEEALLEPIAASEPPHSTDDVEIPSSPPLPLVDYSGESSEDSPRRHTNGSSQRRAQYIIISSSSPEPDVDLPPIVISDTPEKDFQDQVERASPIPEQETTEPALIPSSPPLLPGKVIVQSSLFETEALSQDAEDASSEGEYILPHDQRCVETRGDQTTSDIYVDETEEEESDYIGRYIPRYHQRIGHPAKSLLEYFYVDLSTMGPNFNESASDDETIMDGSAGRGSTPLSITFKRKKIRDELLTRHALHLWEDDDRRNLELEFKFVDLQDFANDIYQRFSDQLEYKQDLISGTTEYAMWSIQGECPDPDIFDMLMVFGELRREGVTFAKRTGRKLDDVEVTDIVQPIPCRDFNHDIFKLPIKLFGNMDGDEDVDASDGPALALSFIGNVNVRYDVETRHYRFSGLYQPFSLEGRDASDIDLHARQFDR